MARRAAVALLAVALLAACGDDDDDAATPDPSTSTSTTTTEAASDGSSSTTTTTTAPGTDDTSDTTPSTTGGSSTDPGPPPEGDPEESGEAPDVLTEAESGNAYRMALRSNVSLRLANPPTWGDPVVDGDAVRPELQPYEVDPGFTEYLIFAENPGRGVVRFAGDREVVFSFEVYED